LRVLLLEARQQDRFIFLSALGPVILGLARLSKKSP
jgi:hypothetical protein